MFGKKTPFQGSNIPEWVLETKNNRLFESKDTSKRVMIKQVLHASHTENEKLELLLTELCDGDVYIPAIFEANMVREKIGRTDLANMNGCREFDSQVINITKYMISACRLGEKICPYIIVLNFQIVHDNNIRYSLRSPLVLTNVCNNDQVMPWIGNIKRMVEKKDKAISSWFNLECLKDKFVDYQSMEYMLEFLLSKMYHDSINVIVKLEVKGNEDDLLEEFNTRITAKSNTKKKKPISSGHKQHIPHVNDVKQSALEAHNARVMAEWNSMTKIPDSVVVKRPVEQSALEAHNARVMAEWNSTKKVPDSVVFKRPFKRPTLVAATPYPVEATLNLGSSKRRAFQRLRTIKYFAGFK